MDRDEPDDFLSKAVEELKADLVRFVMYEVHQAGRDGSDAKLAREIAVKIDEAVANAIKARLEAPGNAISGLTDRANEAEQRFLRLANQSSQLLEGIQFQIETIKQELASTRSAMATLAQEASERAGVPYEPPPEPDDKRKRSPVTPAPGPAAPRAGRGPLAWVRAHAPSGAKAWLVGVIILVLLAYAGMYLTGTLPWTEEPDSGASPALSASVRSELNIAFDSSRGELAALQEMLGSPRIRADAPLSAANLGDTEDATLANLVHETVRAVGGLRDLLVEGPARQFFQQEGTRQAYVAFSTAYGSEYWNLVDAANAFDQAPARDAAPPKAGAAAGERRDRRQQRDRGPTAAVVKRSTDRLLEATINLREALSGLSDQ